MNNGLLAVNQVFEDCMQNISNTIEKNINNTLAKGPFMSANDKQIGGNHYDKSGEQHWDRMFRLYGRGYFVGCSTGYIERYHLKNGKQDLKKAIHFIQKLIELEYPEEKEKGLDIALKEPANWDEFYAKQSSEPISDILKELDSMAREVAGIPDHLKEFVPTDRQKEVAAKFEDLREKHMNAISPMMQRILEDKEWDVDADEPLPNGYVNQDK